MNESPGRRGRVPNPASRDSRGFGPHVAGRASFAPLGSTSAEAAGSADAHAAMKMHLGSGGAQVRRGLRKEKRPMSAVERLLEQETSFFRVARRRDRPPELSRQERKLLELGRRGLL